MAISVEGYGNITQGNAKEIYTAWKRGEVELNKSQQTKCEAYLSPEDKDEIQYDEQVVAKKGSDKIVGSKDAEEKGGSQAGNATGASLGAAIFAAGAAALCKISVKKSLMSGFVALGMGAATLACSILSGVCVKAFDDAYDERTAARDGSDQSNSELDSYSEALGNTMEMMNEDVELYKDQSNQLTTAKNVQVSQGAELQMEYESAMAAGDTQGAQRAKEQMKALEKTDNSSLEEDLAETGGALEEYRAMNVESAGCADAGQSVSDFLKQGKPLGIVATLNTALLAVATVYAGLAIGSSLISSVKDAVKLNFAGAAAGIAGAAMFAVALGLLGTNTYKMGAKAKSELECGSAGNDMQDHVNSLNDMIEQQTQYTDDTETQFAKTDDASAESQAAASKSAGEAVNNNKEKLGKMEKDDEESGVGAGGGAAA